MSRFIKLPDSLKAWKINSVISQSNTQNSYSVTKRDYDGSIINGILTHISAYNERYNSENIKFFENEAKFLKTVSNLSISFTYQEIVFINNAAKNKADLYIITEKLPKLADLIKTKSFTEYEIIDFGIQMSTILELLESKNIYHGNISPDNIYLTIDGKYKLGGFSDFEGKIEDMSFIAPEIAKNGPADFTTDIYSLGLIMYCMANNNMVPFESNIIDRKTATAKRLDGMTVNIPENGSEKLKSVIIIACQLKNENRWKNAGNIKNALMSIQSELPENKPAAPVVAVPEKTDFDENVFDEYEYDDFSVVEPTAAQTVVEPKFEEIDNSSIEITPDTEEIDINTEEVFSNENATEEISASVEDAFEIADVTEIETSNTTVSDNTKNDDNAPADADESVFEETDYEDSDESTKDTNENNASQVVTTEADDSKEEITEDVFDNFDVDGSRNIKSKTVTKDYGSYFEDDNTKPMPVIKKTEVKNEEVFTNTTEQEDKKEKKKTPILLITVCVVVILLVLGFIGFCVVESINNNQDDTQPSTTATEQTTEATTEPTTEQPTTEPETTLPPTTVPEKTELMSVIGYGFSYAKELLEDAGFEVIQGEYRYNSKYESGYIFAQEPESGTMLAPGSKVTLHISAGPEETIPATEATTATESTTQNNDSKKDNTYIFPNSNSAYLSESDIKSCNRNELNIALNEIYARKGRIFKDSSLAEYFNSKSWYTPKYTSEEFSQNVTFNKYEQANLQLIIDEQIKKGYR
ncbi:MAG: YARHG domain-containing protein [Ruminococcus sp.]|nr:YARHG domain-containing protein [Ruminococcus sp.]